MTSTEAQHDRDVAAVLERRDSIFGAAGASQAEELRRRFEGACVVMTGGAGFIARHTLACLLPLHPSRVVLLDVSENGLADVIRDFRGAGRVGAGTRIEPVVVDVAGPLLGRAIAQIGHVDQLMCFAAMKHVRSERDDASLARMFAVNVTGVLESIRHVRRDSPGAPVFAVSTDKAAAPGNVMGATKRLMEVLALADDDVTAARFANVAFSSGSLLASWRRRLAAGQPLPVPAATRRYFISPREAGELCAITATAAPAGHAVTPRSDLLAPVELVDAAARFLAAHGWQPGTSAAADHGSSLPQPADGRYPVVLTELDTAGEKPAEAFAAPSERPRPWLPGLQVLRPRGDAREAGDLVQWVAQRAQESMLPIAGPELHERLARAVPDYAHVDGADLSQRF